MVPSAKHRPPKLQGNRIILRPPRPEDQDDRAAAGRDPEFRRMVGADVKPPGPLSVREAEVWYQTLRADPYGWVIEFAGRCVGEARLHHVEPASATGWLAIGIFRPEHRGRGLGTEAVELLCEHAFEQLGLNRLRLRVLAFNAQAINCYQRCGFREIGRESVVIDSEATEDVLMERIGRHSSADLLTSTPHVDT